MNVNLGTIEGLASLYGLKLLGAAAIFILGRWGIKLAVALTRRLMTVGKVDKTLVGFTCNMLYGLGLVFVIVAALAQLGIQTTSLAAALGAAGLAVGLALQGSLSNLASGVLIIALHPFRLGDRIETSGKDGTVTDINIFTTTLKTEDGQAVIIPNGKITADVIVNHTPA
ncbi:MAG: mechanosensitive ion channel [Alphaproteobacteria bacterium]|nr:mechanosensitive ion channel [Alphaproteobacteria bacterium]